MKEKYEFTYTSPEGVKITREFFADDIYELGYNILQFTRSVGFDYIDMLEFSEPEGNIYRSEVLDC